MQMPWLTVVKPVDVFIHSHKKKNVMKSGERKQSLEMKANLT